MTAPDAHNRPTPGNAPVTAHEADALDAWLESVATPRHVERRRNTSPNGRVEPGTSLQSTAEGFHTRLATAENRSAPDIPVDAIWEKIMATTTIAAPAPSQPHVAGRAAELVSNGVARASRPARTIPAWLSGSHWAVSAFMLAAVVVGIVALYGSFAGSPGSGDDPANPNFAMGTPGETATTPESDIDRWLVDPSTIDCERDPNRSIDWSEVATDRPKAVENYLPFASAGASEAEVIAERPLVLDAGCAPTDADPIVTDDFGWMPGVNGGVIPTDEQVAIAQEISAALPMQNYQSYYLVREPSPDATPEADAGASGRSVLLPQDIVQLPDGRLGGPLRTMIETSDPNFAITDLTEGYEAAGSAFVVFEKIDGKWLYDELFLYCVGDCDWFWAEIANPDSTSVFTTYATPAGATPSADAAWLQPYTPDECDIVPRTLDEVGALMQAPGETIPRQYGPVSPVNEELALEITSANRTYHACRMTSNPQAWRAMMSPRLIYEAKGEATSNPYAEQTYDQYVARNRELSALLLPDDGASYTVMSNQEAPLADDGSFYDESGFSEVILPEHVVKLADGRIGGPLSWLRPANFDAILESYGEGQATPTPLGFTTVRYFIFAQDPAQGNRWVLDETLDLCVEGCDAFYALVEQNYDEWSRTGPTPQASATPSATLAESSPSASTDWLAPIAPDECNVAETRTLEEVGAIMENHGQIVPREYIPITEVEAPLAQDVAGANRAWESCRAQGLIGERRAVESLRYIAEIEPYNVVAPLNSESYDDWVALNETLRASFLDPDAESYLVESEALPTFDCETGYGETDLSAQVSSEVIQPQHLVQLPDGRIGGPVTSLVGSGFLQCVETRPPTMNSGYQAASIHIFAQDSTREGRWALDERFSICVSGCEDYYEEIAYQSAYFYPPWPATPEAATPVAGAASLQPITPEECDVEALTDEAVSAIVQDPDGEVERSYAPTGPVHDALAQEVEEADRAWQSCYVYGTAGERAALQSPRLTRDGPGVQAGMGQDREDLLAELERFDASRKLGDMMLTGDWRDYLIESDLFVDPVTGVVQTVPDFIPTIPIPEQALHLADGRIAIPIVTLVPPGTYPLATEDVDDNPYGWVRVHILTQDPTRDGRWVMDEEIFLCTGDCDLARASSVDYIEYANSLVATPDATPAATPRAWREGQAA